MTGAITKAREALNFYKEAAFEHGNKGLIDSIDPDGDILHDIREALHGLDALIEAVHPALRQGVKDFKMPEGEYEERNYGLVCDGWLEEWGCQPHHAVEDAAKLLLEATTGE